MWILQPKVDPILVPNPLPSILGRIYSIKSYNTQISFLGYITGSLALTSPETPMQENVANKTLTEAKGKEWQFLLSLMRKEKGQVCYNRCKTRLEVLSFCVSFLIPIS